MSMPRDSTDCILSRTHIHQWRAPIETIYISFSPEKYQQAYGTEPTFYRLASMNRLAQLEPNVVKKYSEILIHEWKMRAKMPVEILPLSATAEDIRNKNVIFILARTASQEADAKNDAHTYPFSYPYNPNIESRAHYKVTLMPMITLAEMTNLDINLLLHESAHALGEFKHFKWYKLDEKASHGPYCKLDCTDSVMAYLEDCARFTKAAAELPGPRRQLNFDDPDPQVQSTLKKLYTYIPIQLGPLDLKAAERIKKIWALREEKDNQKIVSTTPVSRPELMKIPTEITVSCVEFTIRNPWAWVVDKLNSGLDWVLAGAVKYANEVGKDCPTYFPPHQTVWQDQGCGSPLLFNNSSAKNSTSALPSVTPTLLLK